MIKKIPLSEAVSTRLAHDITEIREAGAAEIHSGAAVLPGAMFLCAYIGEVPGLWVLACALHHPVTVLDLVLPRVLAGERVGRWELALLGHGGLCRHCPECHYPGAPSASESAGRGVDRG